MKLASFVAALILGLVALAYVPATASSAWTQPDQVASYGHGGQETWQGSDVEEKDLPWVPILIIAMAIPAAVLAWPMFFGGKRGGGH